MMWYEFDKIRVVAEFQKMQNKYPNFKLSKHGDNLAWEGEVSLIPDSVDAPPLRINMVYPKSFPILPIKVYPIEPVLPEDLWGHSWHRWKEGNLCYIQPKLWNPSYFAVDVVEKSEIWYFNYLAFFYKMIDNMPDEGLANIPIKGDA